MNNDFLNDSFFNTQSIITEGMASDEVKLIQQQLKMLGYFSGSITGSFGEDTKEAVMNFQRDNNLAVDGIVGPMTKEALDNKTSSSNFPTAPGTISRPTLKLGDTGSDVGELQRELQTLLYYTGPITNVFDKATENAVKALQLNNKLIADGVVGKHTWDALYYLYSPLSSCEGGVTPPVWQNTYIVKKGDTLYSIAREYNMSVDELMRLNNLTSTSLSVGQELKVSEEVIPPPNIPTSRYIVKRGDSLYSIAREYNTTVDELMRLNNLTSTNLSIGQELIVPNPSTTEITYVVRYGDSLYSIAKKYNVTVDSIKTLNGLTSNLLSVGQVLRIPQ